MAKSYHNTGSRKQLEACRQAETEREARIEQLKARNLELEQLLYAFAHDLNGRLATIAAEVVPQAELLLDLGRVGRADVPWGEGHAPVRRGVL